MHNNFDFDFDILQVASLLNLTQGKSTSEGVYVDCPFCGVKKGKMHLHTGKNLFRCNRCGKSGNMLTLYGDIFGLSAKESYRAISERLRLGDSCISYKKNIIEIKDKNSDVEPADISYISDVYKAFLSMMILSPYHEKMLIKRGFSSNEIIKFGYKSMPLFGYKKTAESLISQGFGLEGVPGFFVDEKDNRWTLKFRADSPGILVPNINIEGEIVCLEKRLDEPYKDNKYFRVSSSGEKRGCKSIGCINFCGNPYDKNVYLTEGSFKSAIAHSVSGKTFMGMPGVSNYKLLYPIFKTLKRNGTIRIIETLDMDKLTNPVVLKLREKILLIIKEFGFKAESLVWDSKYKGIDDYLVSFKREEILQ